jgi:hypothetical protein
MFRLKYEIEIFQIIDYLSIYLYTGVDNELKVFPRSNQNQRKTLFFNLITKILGFFLLFAQHFGYEVGAPSKK